MATRNFETREGFDFWDRLCKIPRYAFLLSKAGNSVQKAEGLGNWIDRDEAMVVMDDAQSEINVLRQDCATMIAELEDLRAQLPSQGVEAVAVYQYAGDSPYKSWTDISKKLFDEYAARGEWLTRTLYTHPADPGAVAVRRQALELALSNDPMAYLARAELRQLLTKSEGA